jgi:hypothetical protein
VWIVAYLSDRVGIIPFPRFQLTIAFIGYSNFVLSGQSWRYTTLIRDYSYVYFTTTGWQTNTEVMKSNVNKQCYVMTKFTVRESFTNAFVSGSCENHEAASILHTAKRRLTVADRSKARNVFILLNNAIVGSYPIRGMDVCLRLSCVRSGLATGWSAVVGILPVVYKIQNFRINSEWEQARKRNPSR